MSELEYVHRLTVYLHTYTCENACTCLHGQSNKSVLSNLYLHSCVYHDCAYKYTHDCDFEYTWAYGTITCMHKYIYGRDHTCMYMYTYAYTCIASKQQLWAYVFLISTHSKKALGATSHATIALHQPQWAYTWFMSTHTKEKNAQPRR